MELQNLKDKVLEESKNVPSEEMRKLIESVGGMSPATSKSSDCSDCNHDCTYQNQDTTKYRQDSSSGTDTIRKDDHCNDKATQTLLKALDNYNKSCNDVVSGDLMGFEGPCKSI